MLAERRKEAAAKLALESAGRSESIVNDSKIC